MSTTTTSQTASANGQTLVRDHADLIKAFGEITGTDQSSIARRAGKIRAINGLELAMWRAKVPFEHFESPAANRVKKSGGQTDAELLADLTELAEVIADTNAPETVRATADTLRNRKLKVAQERGLVDADGNVTTDTDTDTDAPAA